MRFAGIDIGSRTIELVVVDASGEIQARRQADTGFDPITVAQRLVSGIGGLLICDQNFQRYVEYEVAIKPNHTKSDQAGIF